MKKWQQIIAGLSVGAAVLGVLVGPGLAFAADDYGLSATAGVAGVPTDKNVQTIVGNVIGTALSMISVLFFVLMLYAGIKWMLARGDSDEAKKALDTIIAAIIGMLVVLGSYAITNFVFGTLGQGGGVSTSGNTDVGGSGDKTAWNDTDASQRCETHYPTLSCQQKSSCNTDDTAKQNIKNVYSPKGYGLIGSGGYYIVNACPGTDVCCG